MIQTEDIKYDFESEHFFHENGYGHTVPTEGTTFMAISNASVEIIYVQSRKKVKKRNNNTIVIIRSDQG